MKKKIIDTLTEKIVTPREQIFASYPQEFNNQGLATTFLGKKVSHELYQLALEEIKKDLAEYAQHNEYKVKLIGIAGSYLKDNMRVGLYRPEVDYETAIAIDKEKNELRYLNRAERERANKRYLEYSSDIDLVVVPDIIETDFIAKQEKTHCSRIFNKYGVYFNFVLPIVIGRDYISI